MLVESLKEKKGRGEAYVCAHVCVCMHVYIRICRGNKIKNVESWRYKIYSWKIIPLKNQLWNVFIFTLYVCEFAFMHVYAPHLQMPDEDWRALEPHEL